MGTACFGELSHKFLSFTVTLFRVQKKVGQVFGLFNVLDADIGFGHAFGRDGLLVGIFSMNDRGKTPNLMCVYGIPYFGDPRTRCIDDFDVLLV